MEITDDLIKRLANAVRVKSASAHDEIKDLVLACEVDLKIAGVYVTDYSESLTYQAIKLYCKAHYGYDKDSEKFALAYSTLKDSMALSGDYVKEVSADG